MIRNCWPTFYILREHAAHLQQIEITRDSRNIPDTQVLITHQANGSPFAPPAEQIGTWEDPHARLYYFFLDFLEIA